MADDDFAQGQASAASSSSSSSDQDEETEFQSMTAKGVQHLCSELLELKQESDHDFQKIVFSNYAAFLAILREMNCLQSEGFARGCYRIHESRNYTQSTIISRHIRDALGILTGRSRAITNQQPEYLFLSNSGRKFATLLQSVVEDISPLITLEMERSVLQGIIGLFKSYVVILEHAFTGDTDEGHLRINLSESPVQGVSVLANLSTLVQFFSCIVRNLFDGIHHLGNEIENHIMLIRDMYSSLKLHFLDQFISNIFSPDADHESGSEICISSRQGDPRIYDMIPSVPYLELYLELKKLQKLGEDDSIDSNWLISLLGEVTDATFNWMLNKSEIWRINKESLPDHQVEFTQFILDAHFLAEVARSGGYLSDNAVNIFMDIVPHVEATFVSAGLNPPRDVDNKEWLANAAIKALHKLQELHQRETLENENASTEIRESYRLYAPQFGSDTLFGDDKESTVNALESGVDTNTMGSGIIVSPVKENNQEENYRKADERQLESGVDANTMGSGIIVSPVKENNQEEN